MQRLLYLAQGRGAAPRLLGKADEDEHYLAFLPRGGCKLLCSRAVAMGLPVPGRGVTSPQRSEVKPAAVTPRCGLQWRRRRGRAGSGPGRGVSLTG